MHQGPALARGCIDAADPALDGSAPDGYYRSVFQSRMSSSCAGEHDSSRTGGASHGAAAVDYRTMPVPGANEIPRSTSPDAAVRSVMNVSPAGSVAADKLSVITTSWFGSTPWSPFPLTVEVIAHTVTVPSAFTRPVMLRRPSVGRPYRSSPDRGARSGRSLARAGAAGLRRSPTVSARRLQTTRDDEARRHDRQRRAAPGAVVRFPRTSSDKSIVGCWR